MEAGSGKERTEIKEGKEKQGAVKVTNKRSRIGEFEEQIPVGIDPENEKKDDRKWRR